MFCSHENSLKPTGNSVMALQSCSDESRKLSDHNSPLMVSGIFRTSVSKVLVPASQMGRFAAFICHVL